MKNWIFGISCLIIIGLQAQTRHVTPPVSDLFFEKNSRTYEQPEGRWTLRRYSFDHAPLIGQSGGVTFREGGVSGLCYLGDSTFLLIGDRGPNLEADQHTAARGRTALVFPFPAYGQKIWRVRATEGQLELLGMTTVKRPNGLPTSGLPLPDGRGYNGELAWADTLARPLDRDAWGLDSEGIARDVSGHLWLCDEYATSLWQLSPQGRLLRRYTPFPAELQDRPLPAAYGQRRPNRGFEGIAITPRGLIYAILQSPAYLPDDKVGNISRLHRILELDPATGATRTFVYEHQPEEGDIRHRDWKIGDLVAVNDDELLVLEHAQRGQSNVKKVFKISLLDATPITDERPVEALLDAAAAQAAGITCVKKELLADLLALGWDDAHDKPEGLTIVDEQTIAVINDNDYGVASPAANGQAQATRKTTHLYLYQLPESRRLRWVQATPEPPKMNTKGKKG
jgi:hypothetical protein